MVIVKESTPTPTCRFERRPPGRVMAEDRDDVWPGRLAWTGDRESVTRVPAWTGDRVVTEDRENVKRIPARQPHTSSTF